MLGRILICAIMLGSTVPAAAGRRVEYRPAADSLALLMQDDRAVSASRLQHPLLALPELRAFRMPNSISSMIDNGPLHTDLSVFDALQVSTLVSAHFARRGEIKFSLSAVVPDATLVNRGWLEIPQADATTANGGGRYAVREAMAAGQRDYRHSVLEGMVSIDIDGSADTPWLSLSGPIGGALWEMLPRR